MRFPRRICLSEGHQPCPKPSNSSSTMAAPTATSRIRESRVLGNKLGRPIEYRPFLLGGAFKATENQSPAFETCQPKAAYGGIVMQRWVAKHGIKFQRNPFFPINTLPLMRACTAAKMDGVFDAFHAAVFPAFWAESKNMGEPGCHR